MSKSPERVTIKKYANRRLYNTDTSTYVTLEGLAVMVKEGKDFVVFDGTTGEEITRSVLTQIILEQEDKGTNLLPINFLRQIIRFYGDSIQTIVPLYLEASIDLFTKDQGKLREHMTTAFGTGGLNPMEAMFRRNMEMFERTISMFLPFAQKNAAAAEQDGEGGEDIDDLKHQMSEMQKRLDRIADKSGGKK